MADVEKVFLRVERMVKRGGFKLHFDPNVISLKKIFEQIKVLGKDRNLTYESYVIPMK